jgi:hypothetical protein
MSGICKCHFVFEFESGQDVGRACVLISAAMVHLLGLCLSLIVSVHLTPAHAQRSDEQRALLTVRDVVGTKGAPVSLGFQVQAPSREGALITIHLADIPKGASLSDGSRTAVAAKERDLVDLTGWNLANTTLSMPPDASGQFTLTAQVTVENGARPLLTQATFVVAIGDVPPSFLVGPARTIQAEVGPEQIAVRTAPEGNSAQAGPPASSPGQAGTGPPRADAASPPASRDAVAAALAADRKVWLELERTRTDTLTRQLVAAHEQIGELRSKVGPQGSNALELKDADLSRLLTKANELIRPGDVSGARLLLERALESDSAEAAFYLAQTYDPRILDSWNVQGILPDVEKARALYQRAHEAGLSKAKELAELMP